MGFDRHTCLAFLAIMVMGIVPSCGLIYDGEDIIPVEDRHGNIQIGLRISLDEVAAPATKATPEGDYDDGRSTEFENYLDIANARIMFFDSADKFMATFVPTVLRPVEEQNRSKVYELMGTLENPLPSDFKVVIIANWQSYPQDSGLVPGKMSIDDLCASEYSRYAYSAPFTLSTETPIPLFGLKEFSGMTFIEGQMTYLDTIHLLRAMAKVEVSMNADDSVDWNIESVKLRRYNSSAFCAPYGVYTEADYVKGNYDGDYADDIHIVEGVVVDQEIDFVNQDDGRFIIYVPEYRNVAPDGQKASDAADIVVTFDKRVDAEYTIDFKYYRNAPAGARLNQPFDIRRNYYYKFEITKHEEFMDPEISVDIIPYGNVLLIPDYGLTVDDEGNKVDKDKNIVVTGRDGLILIKIATDGSITDRDGKAILLDAAGHYERTDAGTGALLWSIDMVILDQYSRRYSIRDEKGDLIASVYFKKN
ncbi:MAG: FimB/Mfa2 family fimbrial subunit [Clostridium sp.]|nr:FimB/Mfa2 family fimbrial subunit [Bacteroides sp.]MCM1198226.1 FimB/Mfa2 family fimbrial subunit [Clostridium sp.]